VTGTHVVVLISDVGWVRTFIPVEPDAARLATAAESRPTARRNRPGLPLDTDKLRTIGLAVGQQGYTLSRIRAHQLYEPRPAPTPRLPGTATVEGLRPAET